MSFPSGLKAFAEKLADGLMGGFLNTIIYLSLSLLRCFILNFCHYNYKVSWCEPLWADLVWDSLWFLDLDICFLSQVRGFFSYYSNKEVSPPPLGPCNVNVSILDVIPEISNYPRFFIYLFFLFSLVNFHISVFQVAVSSNLLLISFLCINFSYYSSALFHSSLYFLTLC